MTDPHDESSGFGWIKSLSTGRARWIIALLFLAAVGVVTATMVSRKARTRVVTIPAGTRFVAALQQTVTTEHGQVGERVELKSAEPLPIAGGGTIPAGAAVHAEVIQTRGGGRIAGAPELTLRFNDIELGGNDYPISADAFHVRGKNDAKESAGEIGGGAVAGGIVGALAGNTLKGAAVGAVLGTGVAVATKGNQIVLPAGRRLRIHLLEPVKVSYRPAARGS